MADVTEKKLSDVDANNAIRGAFNVEDMTLMTNGFLSGLVGRRIEMEISTTNVPNDTETYTFTENGLDLYEYEVVYTDGTRATFMSAARIA